MAENNYYRLVHLIIGALKSQQAFDHLSSKIPDCILSSVFRTLQTTTTKNNQP